MAAILSGNTTPADVGLSFRQTEIRARARCYQETTLRSLYVMRPGWDALWTTEDQKPYDDAKQGPSVCDVLRYTKPETTSCEDVDKFPFSDPMQDRSVLNGVLRCEVAARRPELQQAIFGWKTPRHGDAVAWQAFEQARARYWESCTHENRMEMHTLQETADFHANDLLRALYLYGEMPPQLRTPDAAWRDADGYGRNVNFSSTIEAQIIDRLLMFKYWIDEPFAVVGSDYPRDSDLIIAERKRLNGIKKHDGGPAKQGDEREYPSDLELDREMTSWSENHQLLFATAEYLAGQWMPDAVFRAGNPYRSEGADRTRPGDLIGSQHMAKARVRLVRWLDGRLRFGFSEWNAPGYYDEDLSPLFNLADFCMDEQVRVRACMVLDLIFFDLARFSLKGNFGVTAGRDYFEHKNCGYGESVGDLIEVAFGTRDGVIVNNHSGCAVSFTSSRRYVLPDAIVEVALDPHPHMIDRSRISLTIEEAPLYGIGVESDEDVMFWWSRAAYFVKQVIDNTERLARKSQLMHTSPFKDILPKIEGGAVALSVGDGLAFLSGALAIPGLSAFLAPLLKESTSSKESDVADAISVLTEGSALTRANLYTYKDSAVMLSSAQNFRRGQFSFQAQAVVATLSMEAMVWTGHPSAGAYIPREALETVGEGVGGFLGAAVGGILGPAGGIAGAIIGAHAGKKTGDSIAGDDPRGIEIYPADTHDGPNWWTGTVTAPRVVQRDNAAIAIYKPKEFQKLLFGKHTHAWFPMAAFEQGTVFQRSGNSNIDDGLWTFGKTGDGYVALYSSGKPVWTTDGPWKDKELRIEASGNVFIYQVGSAEQFGSYDSFVEKVSNARIHVDDLDECSYDIPFSQRLELHYDEGVRFAGRGFSDDKFPRFQNPYVSSGYVGWNQYHYTIARRGATLTHDFRELKTVAKNPKVHREIQGSVRHERDNFMVIAHHGSPKTSVENTIQSCHQAVQVERANALEIDLCLTSDDEVVLWHDWDPDDAVSLIRQLGLQGSNRFRPTNPDIDSGWRKPIDQLTLAEFRAHYGYAEIHGRDYVGKIDPVDATIPTLGEFMAAAVGWDQLEELFLDVKLPDSAAHHAAKLLDLVVSVLARPHAFTVTMMVPSEKVVEEMLARAKVTNPDVTFTWDRELPAGVILNSGDYSAIDGAIRYGNRVASVGRPTSATLEAWHVYQTVIEADIHKWDAFNLDPKVNKGRQIDKLIAWTINDSAEMDWLLDQGVSGIITDDVHMLREAVTAAQLPLAAM